MRHNPTPLKSHEQRYIGRFTVIVVIIIIAMSIFFSSCATENLCRPHYADQMIVRVDEKYVYTEDFMGREIPHRIYKYDTTNYQVGKPLILIRGQY